MLSSLVLSASALTSPLRVRTAATPDVWPAARVLHDVFGGATIGWSVSLKLPVLEANVFFKQCIAMRRLAGVPQDDPTIAEVDEYIAGKVTVAAPTAEVQAVEG